MAICHVRCSSGSRGGGQSGAAKVDYVRREGKYERGRDDLVEAGSGNLPAWAAGDARTLFAAADVYERANGRLFVEVESALPNELDAKERGELVRAWVGELASGKLPYAYAVHAGRPKVPGEPANPHVHVVLSERVNDGVSRDAAGWFRRANRKDPAAGGAAKDRGLKDRSWVEATRGRWERLVNAHLERAGRPERITAESHATRIERAEAAGERATAEHLRRHPPGRHLGPAAAAIERDRAGRDGRVTERGELARAPAAETARLREELAAVDRQLRRLREESERPRGADAQVPVASPHEDARRAAAGPENGPQVPEPSEASRETASAVPRPVGGDSQVGGASDARAPAAASAAPKVSHEEQVQLAADVAEARLPRAKPGPGNQDPPLSDETPDRLAASTEDTFVRDTVAAVRRRQSGDDARLRARAQEESERPRGAESSTSSSSTREEVRRAAGGPEVGPQAADVRPPAAVSASPGVSHEEQVQLAADVTEARLPRAKPGPGNPDPLLAVSDETLDRLAATTEDGFVRDTVAAVRRRQSGDDAHLRARAEAEHQAPAAAREHARLVAEHQEATRRRERTREPTWEDAARAVVERYLAQLRRVFEEACAWVREQLRRSGARDAPAAAESGPPVPEPSRSPNDRGNDVPPPGVGGGRTGVETARAPAEAPRPPAEPSAPVVVAIPHEERVRLAADTAEAWLPRAKPAPGNPLHQPLAVSDRSLDRLAAATEDRFVRDTIIAVRSRQFPYHAYDRARAEEDRHAPAINREHARLVAEHEQATRRRWWQLRRPESPEPAWEDTARQVIERSLPEVRLVFKRACVQTPEFQERRAVDDRANAAVRALGPAVPVPSRVEARPPARTPETLGAAAGSSGAREQEAPPSRVEHLLEERARIEQLYEQAREMSFSDGRTERERAAMAAEEALERQVRELPWAEQRELQSLKRAQGLDRGGPSR